MWEEAESMIDLKQLPHGKLRKEDPQLQNPRINFNDPLVTAVYDVSNSPQFLEYANFDYLFIYLQV